MKNCNDCTKNFGNDYYLSCPNCGAEFCPNCANKTKGICPKCYASLELK